MWGDCDLEEGTCVAPPTHVHIIRMSGAALDPPPSYNSAMAPPPSNPAYPMQGDANPPPYPQQVWFLKFICRYSTATVCKHPAVILVQTIAGTYFSITGYGLVKSGLVLVLVIRPLSCICHSNTCFSRVAHQPRWHIRRSRHPHQDTHHLRGTSSDACFVTNYCITRYSHHLVITAR